MNNRNGFMDVFLGILSAVAVLLVVISLVVSLSTSKQVYAYTFHADTLPELVEEVNMFGVGPAHNCQDVRVSYFVSEISGYDSVVEIGCAEGKQPVITDQT